MKSNYQRGTIYEASDTFFVRYFAKIDGVKKRVSHKLCDRDAEHDSTTCPSVLALRDEHMVAFRKSKPTPNPATEVLITDYWEQVYLPTVKQGLKPSTVAGYRQIWDQFLMGHFTGRTFVGMSLTTATSCLTILLHANMDSARWRTFAAWPLASSPMQSMMGFCRATHGAT